MAQYHRANRSTVLQREAPINDGPLDRTAQLQRELEETREQLRRQKSLKEMFINREKEARRELERLNKYADPETLATFNIASKVQSNLKHKKKKMLQVDYEELQTAYIVLSDKSAAEIHMRDNAILSLQEEVARLNASHQDTTMKSAADLHTAREEADTFRRELEDTIHHSKVLQREFEAEKVAHALSLETVTSELQAEKEKVKALQEELDQVNTHFDELTGQCEADVKARQQANDFVFELQVKAQHTEHLEQALQDQRRAHELSLQTVKSELQAERDIQIQSLQEEVDGLNASHQDAAVKSAADLHTAREEADTLRHVLEDMIHEAKVLQRDSEANKVVHALSLETVRSELEAEREQNLRLQEDKAAAISQALTLTESLRLELDKEVHQHRELQQKHEELLAELKQEKQGREHSLVFLQALMALSEEPTPDTPAAQHHSCDETPAAETVKTPSKWKRLRHALGLRKPQSWKRPKQREASAN